MNRLYLVYLGKRVWNCKIRNRHAKLRAVVDNWASGDPNREMATMPNETTQWKGKTV